MYVILVMHENYVESTYIALDWEDVELFFSETDIEWFGAFPLNPVENSCHLTEEEGHGLVIHKATVLQG